jgi:predicted deacylase
MRIACIDSEAGELLASQAHAIPLAGIEYIRSPSAAIIAYMAQLGTSVKHDDHVATVVDSCARAATARVKIQAQPPRKIYARLRGRVSQPGSLLVTIAGEAAASTPSDITLLSD